MKTLDNFDFKGRRAVMRVDFNVPLDKSFQVTDNTRIVAAVPSIKKILKDGGSVVLMSHLGRPKEGPTNEFSLKHIVKDLSAALGVNVQFADDCISDKAFEMSAALKAGEVLLLENLRFYKQEEKGDETFAQKLAKHGDVYVNDAFGTAHRAHASTTIIAKYHKDKVCGYVMYAEVANAKKVLENAQRPFTAIMGGAKISDKILVIEKLLDKVDNLLIGGAMAYTFAKAFGGKVGKSLVEEDKLELAKTLVAKAKEKNVNLILPKDSVIADAFKNDAKTELAFNDDIKEGYMGLDIGPATIAKYKLVIEASKTVLWNGPMGVFEMPNFSQGTIAVVEAVVRATRNGAFSLIGGGDSAAAVNSLGFGEDVSYVSTGGGALLEYMEGKVLPGVAALEA
ncbi:MAG: phosphoglycerate kinase [Flammeovirgaceae bacterium]